ncbi:TetR/AcrR family transcriptional regulator [Variovorax ginsengisoli]|uniref:AcrR family transcriptional regulator n=1 Tax=Variovorax ginsengisoli TaxID=363844 RepID=A0ABT9SCE4_9BURK|nr:TetR/AcrR family transcriptional regulator [Variovorax ginsengisoli]MDP9901082.1 AcrR family transcriptional regulator [Variovorax ginsengisoli]
MKKLMRPSVVYNGNIVKPNVSIVNLSLKSMTASYHHGDLRNVLLAYAREQLERASLDGLSMREMAKAIGVSHTAAYRHFQDRRALLQAVAVDGFQEMLGATRAAAGADRPFGRAQLKASGLAYIRFGLMHPRLLAHMFSAVGEPDAPEDLVHAGAQLFEVLLQLVSTGQEEGVFRAGDARQLSHACWAMVHGLTTLMGVGVLRGAGDAQDTDLTGALQEAAQALDVFIDGLSKPV